MKHMLQVVPEQIDEIIVSELKWALEMELSPNLDEGGCDMGGDPEMIIACKKLLSYYMTTPDYNDYLKTLTK